MKTALSAALVSTVLLGACTAGAPGMSVNLGIGSSIGRHIGLGTSVSIPVRLDQGQTDKSGGLNIIEEQIVTYFDAQGRKTDKQVPGGFHRQLISKRSSSDYLVQDFYSDNSRKRTDPMIIPRNALFDFDAHPADGTRTVYAYNGSLMQQQVYQNNRLINARY
ncbi:NemA protein [Neisseria leonii]|uniref:NemA protein n=1 Tax=Neisseria leonii TaxID=2995413 RepID=UPI0030D50030